jgi:hypothetical protein
VIWLDDSLDELVVRKDSEGVMQTRSDLILAVLRVLQASGRAAEGVCVCVCVRILQASGRAAEGVCVCVCMCVCVCVCVRIGI